MSNHTIGNFVLKFLKKRAFKPYQISPDKALEKQNKMMEKKFRIMERTDIGKKLGITKGTKIEDIEVTDYGFYEPFYKNASPKAFMYPLEDYVKIKTSGTAGTEKIFLVPERAIGKAFRETALQSVLALFHDGERINLELGDVIYVNTGSSPFVGGTIVSIGSKNNPFISLVPNVNLTYLDKVQYFIRNHKKIDAAFMQTSTLLTQIMPSIEGPINLKGFATFETPSIEKHRGEIESFVGTIPKSLYGSTETNSCSVMSVQHSMGFIFDYRRGLFEFYSVKHGEEIEEESVPMKEVSVGETYQLVYTDFYGEITRYDTKDCFMCIAKGDDVLSADFPVFRVAGRVDKTISIENYTRISEQELLIVFNKAGIPFEEFTARVETRSGREYLTIFLEHLTDKKSSDIRDAVHKQLYSIDKDYRDLVDHRGYVPIVIIPVQRGVFAKYLDGKTGSIAKVDRINMREEDFNTLCQLMNR
jgi:phenylacetate-coenzyme A ligase PaaK-like adenylate-forming protein